ncbi:zinc ABC transporter substrate-binding protein [Proteus mirabilis]|nr:zinc ABC transporter substrate-binding protein [Proteus mirabilis]
MTKNELYIDMMYWILPQLRNIQSRGMIAKAKDKSCYYELQLIHNLPKKILSQDFDESDISFLNYQAKTYIEKCSSKISILYDGNVRYIKMLFDLVPNELRHQLRWNGPIN